MRGDDKLLQSVDGEHLLHRMARLACAVTNRVLVCLPLSAPNRVAALNGLPVTQVPVADSALGMAHSLRTGIAALPKNCCAVMVVPADMPEITQNDFETVLEQHKNNPDRILRGCSETGRAGHPVLFPYSFFGHLLTLSGDTGAREVLKAHANMVTLVSLPGNHALVDLDTPEEWDSWRTQNKSGPVT